MQHSPYTVEGEIEGFARFASGARHARGAKRYFAKMLAVVIALPFLVTLLVTALRWVFGALF